MTPRASFQTAATARFLAALCLSLLVHFSAPLFLSGGASRLQRPVDRPRHLSVQVVPAPRTPTADPAVPALSRAEEKRDAREPLSPPMRPKTTISAAPAMSSTEPQRPAGAVPDAPDLTYYPAKQLDVYPTLKTTLDLRYSDTAADAGITGRALLLVLIDEIGVVKDVSVVEAEPAGYFEDDAKRAFVGARFTPAQRSGRAVRSRVLIEVNYGVGRGSP